MFLLQLYYKVVAQILLYHCKMEEGVVVIRVEDGRVVEVWARDVDVMNEKKVGYEEDEWTGGGGEKTEEHVYEHYVDGREMQVVDENGWAYGEGDVNDVEDQQDTVVHK